MIHRTELVSRVLSSPNIEQLQDETSATISSRLMKQISKRSSKTFLFQGNEIFRFSVKDERTTRNDQLDSLWPRRRRQIDHRRTTNVCALVFSLVVTPIGRYLSFVVVGD